MEGMRHCKYCGKETDYTPICGDVECQILYLRDNKEIEFGEWIELVNKLNGNNL